MPGVDNFSGGGFRPTSTTVGNPAAALRLIEVQLSAARVPVVQVAAGGPIPPNPFPRDLPRGARYLLKTPPKTLPFNPPRHGDPRLLLGEHEEREGPPPPAPAPRPLPTRGTGFEDEDIARQLKKHIGGLLRGEVDEPTPGIVVTDLEERFGKRIIGQGAPLPIKVFNWLLSGSQIDPAGLSEPGAAHVGADGARLRIEDVHARYRQGLLNQRERDEQLAALLAQNQADVYRVWIEFLTRFRGFGGLAATGAGPPGSSDP